MGRLCSVSNNVASLETVTGGVTASGNFAGCTGATNTFYANGYTGATRSVNWYQSYFQSSAATTNLNGLIAQDIYGVTQVADGWFTNSTFYLPSSAAGMSAVDWFVANPNKRIVDYCAHAWLGSTCYGHQ